MTISRSAAVIISHDPSAAVALALGLPWAGNRAASRRAGTERGVERHREYRVVVRAVLAIQHVRVLEPAAAEHGRVLDHAGCLAPQRIVLAAPAAPGIERDVDQRGRVARGPRDAERRGAGSRARVAIVARGIVAARACDLARVTDPPPSRRVGDGERVRVALLEEQPLAERRRRRIIGVPVGGVGRQLSERSELLDLRELLFGERIYHLVTDASGQGEGGYHNRAPASTHRSPWERDFAIRLVAPARRARRPPGRSGRSDGKRRIFDAATRTAASYCRCECHAATRPASWPRSSVNRHIRGRPACSARTSAGSPGHAASPSVASASSFALASSAAGSNVTIAVVVVEQQERQPGERRVEPAPHEHAELGGAGRIAHRREGRGGAAARPQSSQHDDRDRVPQRSIWSVARYAHLS